jgi:hypothetical protein
MRSLYVLVALAALCLAGCLDSSAGDVAGAERAAAQAPKSVEELPADMPPEARASAAAAIGQSSSMQQQANDPARARALQEMNRQRG